MKRPKFNKIDVLVSEQTAFSIPDGVVYAENPGYPVINYKGWSITRYPNKSYFVSSYTCVAFCKLPSFKKSLEYINRCNNPVLTISVIDLITNR